MNPLILSLVLDQASEAFFDRLRSEHFPADRLVVGAHVTVLHALPEELPVLARVQQVSLEAFGVPVTGIRNLGRGVAFELSAPPVEALREELAAEWGPALTPQDRQRWRPHITVQNKVTPERARLLHAHLSAQPLPSPLWAGGLAVWRYVGGPWRHLHTQPLTT